MIELLAPGGNINNVKLAFATGADAVYIGMKQFSARNKCDNFDYSELEEIILTAKLLNKKVYVALNTVVKDIELDSFFESVKICEKLRVDAIIIQDLFMGKFLIDSGCTIPLHASTQSGVCNVDSAKLCEEIGFERIILSRETGIEEIRKIRKATSLEIEYFIQGALCVCFSGNCYFSSAIDGNSGNRGKCFQPCRKKYTLQGDNFSKEGYLISPKDLCMDEHIHELIEAGVCSFKIEGRLRRSEYVGASVSHYRSIIDKKPQQNSKRDLKVAFNRGDYSNGYLYTRKSKVIAPNIQNHIGIEIGKVVKQTGKSRYFVKSKYIPNVGDGFKIIYNGKEIGGVEHQKGLNSNNDGFEIYSNLAVVGSSINLTTDKSLESKYSEFSLKIPLYITYKVALGEYVSICYYAGGHEFEYTSNVMPDVAQKSPLPKEKFEKSLTKLGDTIFSCANIKGEFDNNIFMGVSQINEIRRASIELFVDSLKSTTQNSKTAEYRYIAMIENESRTQNAVIFDEYSNVADNFDNYIFKPTVYSESVLKCINNTKGDTYLYIPCFYDEKDREVIINLYNKGNFAGIFAESYGGLYLAKELNCKIFIGEKLNITNKLSYKIASMISNNIVWSKELAIYEIPVKTGYVLSHGGYEVMTFAHCPLIANDVCTCKNCKYSENINYIDENDREFKLKRMKINECQFNLYYDTGVDSRDMTTEFSNLCDYTVVTNKNSRISAERGVK